MTYSGGVILSGAESSLRELSAQSKDPYLLIGSMHLELAGEGARPTRTY